jgi:hypothetical protein
MRRPSDSAPRRHLDRFHLSPFTFHLPAASWLLSLDSSYSLNSLDSSLTFAFALCGHSLKFSELNPQPLKKEQEHD